jgi:hypothetical protein
MCVVVMRTQSAGARHPASLDPICRIAFVYTKDESCHVCGSMRFTVNTVQHPPPQALDKNDVTKQLGGSEIRIRATRNAGHFNVVLSSNGEVNNSEIYRLSPDLQQQQH